MQKDLNIISLDGRLDAHLDWKQASENARLVRDRGLKIFWNLDLGLFKQLKFSLSNQMQFNALFLSLEHFRDTIWKEFAQDSLGLCFCCSEADFSKGFTWEELQNKNWHGWLKDHFKTVRELSDEIQINIDFFENCSPENPALRPLAQLFCRDVAAEYMQLLAANLTDSIPLYVQLDASGIADPLMQARLTTTEKFDPFQLMVQDSLFCHSKEVKIGVCLPSMDLIPFIHYQGLKEALAALIKKKELFRIIPEYSLIHQWDGLDDLIVVSSTIGIQGRRKLQGFCAAGGRILTLGSPLGLPHETAFE
jgi:hypothetical protein